MNRISFLLFAFVLSFGNLFAQNWNTSTPYAGRMNDLAFITPKLGFACGQGAGIGNCTGSGLMLKTIDGGNTWVRMNTSTTNELTRVQFIDPLSGWALGASSTVIHTVDGGMSWSLQTSGIGAGLRDMYFVNNNVGFICGLNGLLRKTSNGGAAFTTIASGITSTIYALSFPTASVGYFVGDNGVVKKTVNGGTSFSSVYSGSDAFRDVQFLSTDTGFVISPYVIKKTTNGGGAWSTFNAPSGLVMTRLYFVNANLGFVICDQGYILKTIDGGQNWNVISTPTNSFIYSIAFPDPNIGYYGIDAGRIFKSTNGGDTWSSNVSGFVDELMSIRFKNSNVGVAVGKNGTIFRTNNGGLNWRLSNLTAYSGFNNVRWLNSTSVIASGYSDVLIRSDDEGITWHDWLIPVRDSINDIQVLDSLSYFFSYGTGHCMKTTDGGITWDTSMHTGSPYPLEGIFFLNNNVGYTCGQNLVYKTVDGGDNWQLKNDSINLFSSFNDIQFTSADTGFVAGDFGPLYRTTNGGAWWIDLYPSPTSNCEVNEMQFFTNDSGMFAGLNSQRVTNNAGVNLSTMPTACLANNWTTNSISVLNNGFGYCVGGQLGLLHTLQRDSLIRTYVQDSVFCTGDYIFVGYIATGFLLSTQVFSIELSDANGSFASPQVIGTFQKYNPMTFPSGIITCQLPSGVSGNGFRVRVVSALPALIGPDNGFDITIGNAINSSVQLNVIGNNFCEGKEISFEASNSGAGLNPSFSWTLDNQLLNVNSSVLNIDSLSGLHHLSVTMNSSLACAQSSATDSISFSVNAKPFVNAGPDQSICKGDSIAIGDALNGSSVSWTPGGYLSSDTTASPIAFPLFDETYIVEKIDNNGCSNSDTVLVHVNDLPLLMTGSDVFLCQGDSAMLSASGFDAGVSLTWSPSSSLNVDTGNVVYAHPLVSTMYTVTATDPNNCSSQDFLSASVFPVPAIPFLTIVNGDIIVAGNTQNLTWYLNGSVMPGIINDTLVLPSNGDYSVMATDNNGCTAVSSILSYTIQAVNIPDANYFAFQIVNGSKAVIKSIPGNAGLLKILDVNGKELMNRKFVVDVSGAYELALPEVSEGLYFVNVSTAKSSITFKWIVNH
jgi:photosystem II stability/assembly factor-like uncharacterized protein